MQFKIFCWTNRWRAKWTPQGDKEIRINSTNSTTVIMSLKRIASIVLILFSSLAQPNVLDEFRYNLFRFNYYKPTSARSLHIKLFLHSNKIARIALQGGKNVFRKFRPSNLIRLFSELWLLSSKFWIMVQFWMFYTVDHTVTQWLNGFTLVVYSCSSLRIHWIPTTPLHSNSVSQQRMRYVLRIIIIARNIYFDEYAVGQQPPVRICFGI